MKLSLGLKVLVCGMLALGAQSGVAQTEVPTGSVMPAGSPANINRERAIFKPDEVRGLVYTFGRCIVSRFPKQVMTLISLPPGTRAQDKALSEFDTSDCLRGGSLTMSSQLMIAAIYRGLYLRDFGKSQPSLNTGPAVVPASSSQNSVQPADYNSFGDCVVHADPSASRELTMASPGGAAEKAAVAKINSELGSCMPRGVNRQVDTETLAALVAQSLYRESQAASVTLAAGGSH